MFTLSDAEVLPGHSALMAAEHIALHREMCAHTHDFAELALITHGTGEHFTETGVHPLRPRTLVLLGPDSWHSYGTSPDLHFTNLYLTTELLGMAAAHPMLATTMQPVLGALATRGSTLARELTAPQATALQHTLTRIAERPHPTLLGQLSEFIALMDQLIRFWGTAAPIATAPIAHEHAALGGDMLRYSTRVSHAVSLLHDQLDQPWTIARLSSALNTSASQLTRAFRADLQLGPMSYLQRLRAERMAYLLRTTQLTVSAAGRAVGWHDPGYASRRFSAHWGASPVSYRQRVHV